MKHLVKDSRHLAPHAMSHGLRKRLAWLSGIAILAVTSLASAQDRPATTIRQGQLVSPGQSITYYGALTARTFNIASMQAAFAAGTRPVQVRELARGLGAAAVIAGEISQQEYANRAFEYVRQNLKPVFVFGQQKGSLGAVLDQAGTSFDQSNLLVDLLREAQISATYQLGTINLSNTQTDPATGLPRNEVAAWMGITDAAAACRLLADGGIPGEVNGSSDANCAGISGAISSLKLRHVWVAASVRKADGNTVSAVFDPTFKKYNWSSGIDIPAAMGCGTANAPTCGSTLRGLLPTTQIVAGAPAYTAINSANFESSFRAYATTLLGNLKARSPALELTDAIGGPSLDLASMVLPSATLPYATADVTSLNEIPDQYRIRFRVQFATINKQFFADELAGKRLRVLGDVAPDNANHTATALNVVLYAEYEIVASNNNALASPGTNPLTLTVDHPYAAVSGTYMDTATVVDTYSLENDNQNNLSDVIRFRFNPFTILNAWGPTGPGTAAHIADLHAKNMYRLDVIDKTNPAHTWSRFQPYQCGAPGDILVDEGNPLRFGCLRLEQPSLGVHWLTQNERLLDLIGRANASEVTTHHIVGYVISGVYWPASMSVDSALSVSSRGNSAVDRQAASFTASSMSARLEGSVIEQSTGSSLGMSGPTVMDLANYKGIPLLATTQANFDTVRPFLTGYPTFVLDRIRTTYILNGYTVLLPKEWKLGFFPVQPGSQSGVTFNFGGYFAYRPDGSRSAYIVSYDNKGTASIGKLDPSEDVLGLLKATDASLKAKKFHNVDLQTGNLSLLPPPDLQTGLGEFPSSLSFQRSYSSGDAGLPQSLVARATKAGRVVHAWDAGSTLRYGWQHNLDVRGVLTSNFDRAMGAQTSTDAAISLATVVILRDLHRGSSNFASEVTATYLANWWGKTLASNAFKVTMGSKSESFLRLADGVYEAESGSGAKLTLPSALLYPEFMNWYVRPLVAFHTHWTLTNTDGSTINFTQDTSYDSSPTNHIASDYFQRVFYPERWQFPNGVYVDFDYSKTDAAGNGHLRFCLKEVRNNLGRRIIFNFATTVRQAEGYCVIGSVSDENNRTVSFEDSVQDGGALTFNPPDHTFTVTLPDGGTVAYHYRSTTDEPGVPRVVDVIDSWSFATDTATPYAQVTYDDLFRVRDVSIAPNNSAGTRSAMRYSIGSLSVGESLKRGESRDALGATSTSFYGKFGQILQAVDPLGRVTSNLYDKRHRLSKTIYPEGNAEEYEYDARSNKTKVTRHAKPGSALLDAVETTEYGEGPTVAGCTNFATCNQVTATIDLRGNRSTTIYNTLGQISETRGPAVGGETPSVKYCYSTLAGISMLTGSVEAVATTVPKPNRVTSFSYNSSNKFVLDRVINDPVNSLNSDCTPVTRPLAKNLTTTFGFDGIGNPYTLDGPRTDVSDVTTYGFDAMRRLKRIDHQLGTDTAYASTQIEYNLDGTTRSTSQKDGTTWRVEERAYWPSGDLRSVTSPEGNSTNYAYNPQGRLALLIDGEGRAAGSVYDLAGQQSCEWRGISDGTPPQNCVWDPATYNGQGRIRYAAYEYTPNGKIRKVIDANNNATEFFHDNLDRLKFTLFANAADGVRCSLSLPTVASMDTATPSCAASGGTTPTYESLSYTVDDSIGGARCGGDNQICRKRGRDGAMTTFTYDALDRMSTRAVTGLPTATFAYNLVNEPRSATNPVGTVNGAAVPAHSVSYDFNDAGQLLYEENLIGGSTYRTAFQHDEAGNTSRITWPDGYFISYWFDALGRMEYVRENSATAGELAHYTYDQMSRPTGLRFAATEANKIGYTYEPDSNLDTLTNTLASGNVMLDYAHNRAGQIRSIESADAFSLTPAPAESTAFVPNKLNQYGSIGGVAASYDANGNLLSWGTAPNQSVYTYDVENRLRTSRLGSGPVTTYDYDALGRRISRSSSVATTYFLPSADNELAEYGAGGSLLRRYISGAGTDERIATAEGSATTNPPKSYFHVDHQRTVVATTDDAGRTSGCAANVSCQRMAYDVYGNLSAGPSSGSAFRYTGRRYDDESGLYYYRARYYAPKLGRFLQVDPIGYEDDVNLYAYVKSDPANLVDPTGKNCANMPQDGVTALKCYDTNPNNGPTPNQPGDAILTPNVQASALTGNRPGIFKKGSGMKGFWDSDKYEHGAAAVTDPSESTTVWLRIGGTSCDDLNNPGTTITTYDLKAVQDLKSTGQLRAFLHEHGYLDNNPWIGDANFPRSLGIPNIILGSSVISVVEISGGEIRVRVLEGQFTKDEEAQLQIALNRWASGQKYGSSNAKKANCKNKI